MVQYWQVTAWQYRSCRASTRSFFCQRRKVYQNSIPTSTVVTVSLTVVLNSVNPVLQSAFVVWSAESKDEKQNFSRINLTDDAAHISDLDHPVRFIRRMSDRLRKEHAIIMSYNRQSYIHGVRRCGGGGISGDTDILGGEFARVNAILGHIAQGWQL